MYIDLISFFQLIVWILFRFRNFSFFRIVLLFLIELYRPCVIIDINTQHSFLHKIYRNGTCWHTLTFARMAEKKINIFYQLIHFTIFPLYVNLLDDSSPLLFFSRAREVSFSRMRYEKIYNKKNLRKSFSCWKFILALKRKIKKPNRNYNIFFHI